MGYRLSTLPDSTDVESDILAKRPGAFWGVLATDSGRCTNPMVIAWNGQASAHFLHPVQESSEPIMADSIHPRGSRLRRCCGQMAAHRQRINPAKLVPTLVDDGHAMGQSLAIKEYLDETHPEPALMPSDPLGRAQPDAV